MIALTQHRSSSAFYSQLPQVATQEQTQNLEEVLQTNLFASPKNLIKFNSYAGRSCEKESRLGMYKDRIGSDWIRSDPIRQIRRSDPTIRNYEWFL